MTDLRDVPSKKVFKLQSFLFKVRYILVEQTVLKLFLKGYQKNFVFLGLKEFLPFPIIFTCLVIIRANSSKLQYTS